MPGSPNTDRERDIEGMKQLWEKEYQPDMLKIYPRMVMPGTALEKMYEEGFDMPVDVGDSEVQYILEAMSKLGDGCKNPLIMRFVEDMKVKDIADILNMSENAVSVRLKRCVDRLSKIINHE